MGIVEIEDDELYPHTDNTAAKICASIKSNIPSTPQAKLTRDEIARRCNLQVPDDFKCHQLGQIRPGTGQELQTQDPSQKRGSSVPEAIYNT